MIRYLVRKHPQADPAYRRVVRWGFSAACFYTGLTELLHRYFPRQGAFILFGHRVADDFDDLLGGVPPELFERQMAWLARHFRFLSMDELVGHLHRHEPIPPNSLVFTLDDGFADNYTHALPVLERYRVPATVYLVTDSIETGELPWPQRLAWVVSRTQRTAIEVDRPTPVRLPLGCMGERLAAVKKLKSLRQSLSMADQVTLFQSVVTQCGVPTPRDRMLTWAQVREMQDRGLSFGSHTVNHAVMKHLSVEDARFELVESKRVMESRLGGRVRHFCFPHGSYGATAGRLAEEAGYESYFVPGGLSRTNDHRRSPYRLRRAGLSDEEVAVTALSCTSFYTEVLRPGPREMEKA